MYQNRNRGFRIFILLLIIILLVAIGLILLNNSYTKLEGEVCGECVCAGVLTGETISVSFLNQENTTYSCSGLEYCWDTNKTKCDV